MDLGESQACNPRNHVHGVDGEVVYGSSLLSLFIVPLRTPVQEKGVLAAEKNGVNLSYLSPLDQLPDG